jgi:AcrR family transcriptional regulator
MATTAAARPRREPLTQDRIAKTSLELIDDIGLEEFSTRRLGAALGCEAMAIYNHFASKDALLDAVVDKLIKDVSVPPKGEGWQSRVRGFAQSYRALAHAHPKAFPLLATRRFRTRARNLVDQIISALLEEGFEAILDELSGTFPSATDEHPNIKRVQTFLSPEHYDEIFDRGLSLIIDGFEKK